MQIAFMSCNRGPKKNYAQATLRSVLQSAPKGMAIRVVVDGADARYLGPLASNKRLQVELLSSEMVARRQSLKVYRRIAETCHRALAGCVDDDLLLCQDDVLFARNWAPVLADGVATARRRLDGRKRDGRVLAADFAISLYCTRKLPVNRRPLVDYPARHFFGTQGIYLPRQLVRRLSAYFAKRKGAGRMDDMLMKDFFVQQGIELHALNPNVVQHVGRAGTHTGQFHQSPSFEP